MAVVKKGTERYYVTRTRGRQQVEGKWVGETDRGTGNRRGAVETAKKGV